jgi:GNAT superfamily N-acetyltransferase
VNRRTKPLEGSGTVWEDAAERVAEPARIVVHPARRGVGIGRRLVSLLAAEAERAGHDAEWLRVLPDNASALACDAAAGLRRATPEQEAAFTEGQPRTYVRIALRRG